MPPIVGMNTMIAALTVENVALKTRIEVLVKEGDTLRARLNTVESIAEEAGVDTNPPVPELPKTLRERFLRWWRVWP